MINPVNFNPVVQNKQIISTQTTEQPKGFYAPMENPNMDGLKALACYNQSVANNNVTPKTIQPTLPTILLPEAIHSLDGEKITSANGTLNAIVKKGDKTTTVYKTDVTAPNDAIRKIEVYDNSTGKLVSVQSNYNKIEEGKNPQTFRSEITEFDENGQIKKETFYTDGKFETVVEHSYGPNNFEKRYIVNSDGSSLISEECKDTKSLRIMVYDTNGKISKIETVDRNTESSQTVHYKNGIPSKIETQPTTPIPNQTGINPFADPQLKPAEPYILGYDPKQVEGEKQYYSNGAIERITTKTATGTVTHLFDINGTLTGIEDAQNPEKVKNIIYHNYGKEYTIDEKIGDNLYKATNFNGDGSVDVTIYDEENITGKTAIYNENGILKHYIDTKSQEDKMMMSFNNNGELINIK